MKFRSFPFLGFVIIFFDIISLMAWGLIIFPPSPVDWWIWVIMSIIIGVIPVVASIYAMYFFDIIEIDESEIKKYHFGKLKKTIKWENLVTIKVYPNAELNGMIILSDFDVSYNRFTVEFKIFDKRCICIKYSKEVAEELEKYLPCKLIKKDN